jgi:hypothetical protein
MTGFIFEEVIKVSRIFKAQRISYVGNIPVSVMQKSFCFTDHQFCNMDCSWFTCDFFHRTIKMVNMYR